MARKTWVERQTDFQIALGKMPKDEALILVAERVRAALLVLRDLIAGSSLGPESGGVSKAEILIKELNIVLDGGERSPKP